MITIVLPISRATYLKPVFDCLNILRRPADTELLILTDGDMKLQRAVDRRLDSISYSRIQVIHFGDSPAEGVPNRRHRISAIHNKAKNYVSSESEYVFLLEDDTTYPRDTLDKMQASMGHNVAYIEGVELGRHTHAYVGGWKADNILSPNEFLSVMPAHGQQEIDAGGLYCCLVDAQLYRSHNFEPFDQKGTNGLSCDVNFGLYIRNKGHLCLIDWSIQCDHIGDHGSVNLGNALPEQLLFSKDYKGKWSVDVVS